MSAEDDRSLGKPPPGLIPTRVHERARGRTLEERKLDDKAREHAMLQRVLYLDDMRTLAAQIDEVLRDVRSDAAVAAVLEHAADVFASAARTLRRREAARKEQSDVG